MADRSLLDISVANPLQHPAVAAWNRMAGARAIPERITRLNQGHTTVYRLVGIAPDGGSVIAKLCPLADARRTRTICTQVLPLLRKPALLFFGSVEMRNHRAWMFLEDGGATRCALENAEHRRSFSAWLGALHARMAAHDEDFGLPDTGLDLYVGKARAGRRRIRRGLDALRLERQDTVTLRSVLEFYERVKSIWPKLRALTGPAPRTLVHGDYAPKNVLVRQVLGRAEMFPLDWETAGWGHPAADLGECLDVPAYTEQAREYGAAWSRDTVRGWVSTGKILRHIAAFEWASLTLVRGWPPRGVRRMQARLADAMQAASLKS